MEEIKQREQGQLAGEQQSRDQNLGAEILAWGLL